MKQTQNYETLMELVKGNQELIGKLLNLVKEEEENGLYLMAIRQNGILEPAVDMSGNLVVGTESEVRKKGEMLLGMLPNSYREELDVVYQKIEKDTVEELNEHLDCLINDLNDRAVTSANIMRPLMASGENNSAVEELANNISDSVKADWRTIGTAINPTDGSLTASEPTYWSNEHLEDYYDDDEDDYEEDYWDEMAKDFEDDEDDYDDYDDCDNCDDCDCRCNDDDDDDSLKGGYYGIIITRG